MSLTVDWTRLPVELVEKISEFLTIYADYIRFRAVCRTWLTSLPKTPNHLPPQLPWLMVPNAIPDRPCHVFLDLSINKFYFIDLPETSYRKRHCGSSHGWLIIMDETPNVLLVNPLSRAKVKLPHLYTFPNIISFDYNKIGGEYMLMNQFGYVRCYSLEEMRDSFIKKIVLSSNPSKQRDFVAVAILCETGKLAYCRNGGLSPWGIVDDAFSSCEDVIHYKGLFYAVNKYGRIAVCDVNSDSPKVSMVDIQRPQNMRGDILYLIGSGDGLTVVSRYLETDMENQVDGSFLNYRTVKFKVYRLDWGGREWERVRNLRDQVLFVGQNDSMALSASEVSGYMGNCIYYTDDYSERNYEFGGDCDLGIYKLSDGSIEPLASYPRHSWPTPLWVTPNP